MRYLKHTLLLAAFAAILAACGSSASVPSGAVAKCGKDSSPYVLKAIIQHDMGQINEARATLAQAQQVDPHNGQATALLAAFDRGQTQPANPPSNQPTIVGHPEVPAQP